MTTALLAGGLAIAAAAAFGGFEWALLSAVALVAHWRVDFRAQSLIASLGISLAWLALYVWSGDRRLFFPYAMQIAAQMACLLRGRVKNGAAVGGGSVTVLFLGIRIAQSASARVLAVEGIVAVFALVIPLAVQAQGLPGQRSRIIAGALSSALAFAGLAF